MIRATSGAERDETTVHHTEDLAMRVLSGSRPTVGVADASSSAPPLLITPAAAAGMVGEAQLQPAAAGRAGSVDAGFDSDMVIILAALLCVLVCALGLNSLIHYCLVLDFGRTTITTAVAAPAPGGGDGTTGTTGLKKRKLRRIPVVVYEAKPGASATDCAICLGEFDDGDKVRVLPRCHHLFHMQCVDMWLAAHPSCPTCRNSLLIQPGRRHAGGGDGEATTVAGEET